MLKEVLKGTLIDEVRDIMVNYDPVNEDSTKSVLKSAGKLVPLVYVCNTNVPFGSIQYFELSYGKDFLPQFELSFNDNANFMFNDFPLVHDIATLYIGNTADTEFKVIKADFLIDNAEQDNGNIRISAHLFVDDALKQTMVQSFDDMTSIDVIKKICEDTGLGLVTNIDGTDDKMTWLQCNETYLSFIRRHVLRHMWLGKHKVVKAFIDPWYRLTLVDVFAEMEETPLDDTITIDNIDGKELPKPQKLILNNNVNGENWMSRFTKYGMTYNSASMRRPSAVNVVSMQHNLGEQSIDVQTSQPVIKQESTDKVWDTFADYAEQTAIQLAKRDPDHSNVHEHFYEAAAMYDWSQGMLDRVILSCTLQRTLNQLYVFKTLNVEIWSIKNKLEEPTKPDEKATDSPKRQPSVSQNAKNLRLSGKYISTALKWNYTKSGKLSQTVELQRRMWPVLDIDNMWEVDS